MPPPRPCSKVGGLDKLTPGSSPRSPAARAHSDRGSAGARGVRGYTGSAFSDLCRLWIRLLAARAGHTHWALPVPLNPIRSAPSFARALWPSERALRLPGRSGPCGPSGLSDPYCRGPNLSIRSVPHGGLKTPSAPALWVLASCSLAGIPPRSPSV